MSSYWPIRCYTCGKVLGHLHSIYTENIDDETVTLKEIMDKMKLVRYCCRRMIMGYVDFESNMSTNTEHIRTDSVEDIRLPCMEKLSIKD